MTEDSELQLFAEQAAWIAPHLPDPTRRGLLRWLATHLSEGAGQRIARLLPLDHPVQQRAEAAVVELLERRLAKSSCQLSASEVIGRNVDWPHTLERAAGMTPTVHFERRRVSVPDRSCIGALAALGRTWLALVQLGDTERHRRREEALRLTLRRVGPVTSSAPFTQRMARNLSKLDSTAAQGVADIWCALRFWEAHFDCADAAALLEIGRQLRSDCMENPDHLLEVSATLSICRAACQLPQSCITKQIWAVEWRTRGERRTELVLKTGPLRCTVYKGKPHPAPAQEDRLNHSLRLMGLAVRGNQPDINLRFERDGCPGAVYILADAKRNWTGDGVSYLRAAVEVAAAYALSFSHLLGTLHDESTGTVRAVVNPAVTLFCRRSVAQVMAAESPSEIVERLRTAPELPAIVAFDMERHFGAGPSEWSSPVLSAWFDRVSRDANSALLDGRGIA